MQAIYHGIAAIVMSVVAMLHPAACGVVIGLMWLMRELAQRNSSDMIAAIKSMPTWSVNKHLEWLVPSFVSVLTGAMWRS